MGEIVGNRATNRIAAASLPKLYKTPGYYADGGGLYLQVISPTSRTWMFRFMLNKRAREMSLGSADLWDLTTVRAKATDLRRLLEQGIDPIEQRQQAKRQQVTDAALRRTFEQCVLEYHALHAGAWKNAKHAAQWTNTLKTYAYPVFGDWPVSEITDTQIVVALKAIWETKHETATRVLQRIRMVLVWACAKKYRPALPDGMWETVVASLPKLERGTVHHAACPYSKAGALLLAVRDSAASDLVKLGFVFTVLTAARSGEVRGAKWSEIESENAVWTIPAERMKAGRLHRVPLSLAAVEVLKYAKRLAGESDLVFPTPKDRPFSDMVFTQLLRRLEFKYTMHGFRSTFRDWAAEHTQYPREVCEAALAHVVENKTEAAYMRSDFFAKRRGLMNEWAAFLEKTAAPR